MKAVLSNEETHLPSWGSWVWSVKNRIHFDWMPTERTRDDEVERILALGAELYEDHRTAV